MSLTGVGHSGRVGDRRGRHVAGVERGRLPGPDSAWWLALVAVAFTAAQLVFVVPHGGLGWDEVVYVSQINAHASAAWFDPARARGVPLLVAPVTLITSSVLALRVYLSVASGLALFGALMVWRRLRPAWVLAVAGLMLISLWVVEFYGPRAMPDLWLALSGVAAVGFFLRAAAALAEARRRRRAAWGALAGLAACLAVAALMRPGDAVFLAAPLLAAVAVVRGWRRWQLAVAIVAGLIAGGLEWVVEAQLRFGGVFPRLHAAAAEQGRFGLHLGALAQWRGLDGPVQCRPCTAPLHDPALGLWWLALPVLAAAGIVAARRAGRLGAALLPALCGLGVGLQYLVLISYGNPRFLIPTYALMMLPAADAVAWALTAAPANARPLAWAAAAAVLLLQGASQHSVLARSVGQGNHFGRIAADLHRLGVRPPCLVQGKLNIPVAYYAGCESAPSRAGAGRPVAVAVLAAAGSPPPAYAVSWPSRRLRGARGLVVYLPAAR